MKKSLILTSSSEKISPHDGPPSGRAVSDGPLCGGLTVPKIHVILENTLSFSTVLVPVYHKLTLNMDTTCKVATQDVHT